jgi:hypothetical protein
MAQGARFRDKRRSDRINRIYRIGFGKRWCRVQGARIEQVEEAVDVALDAQLAVVPDLGRVPRPQVLHLEPVFDIDGD